MIKTKRIRKSQIIGRKPLGVIAGCEGLENYKNIIVTYLGGDIPILVATDLTQTQWNNLCEGNLTAGDRLELSVQGII